ncbi:iron uptake transporter permease EfeU [Pseudonocardia sp. CA-142604]|uniref:iron uptake transporter permease EfeU n=1 Tax=Pseudonocardia sp. CA-142604 TaxID=3240024 RepID=UPI003D8AF086
MWADAIPNLLIGLREGLEAGLVVSILLAALRQANDAAGTSGRRRISSSAIWLGVLGAVMVAAGFATVLTYATNVLSSSVQEAVGGLLSVLAVGLVTWMVLWMRRTARTLTAQLRGEVARAVAVGAGALTVTAFLAVGREGLETTLFIWTAVKASGSTVAPVIGAAVGLAAAVLLCRLLYERAIRLDLGKFFNRTAIALIVIAAGVLSYGLGDLQDAGWLSGQRWVAFDLTGRVDPNSWWVSILSGVTDLAPRMTVLQVVAWIAYLAVVIPVFLRTDLDPGTAPTGASEGGEARGPGRWERLAAGRPWPVAGVLVVVPIVVAALVIIALPTGSASASTTAVTVTKDGCGREWASGHTGTQTFEVDNKSAEAGEINLDNSSGGVVAEIETIGPATSADMSATLGPGQYSFVCLMSGGTIHGNPVQVSGTQSSTTTTAVKPVTLDDLTGPNTQYQAYAARELVTLTGDIDELRTDLAAGNVPAADAAWLAAQLDWERVGASYDSFGDEGTAVDGLPDGLPAGVNDPGFTGLHRIEYGLYHGRSPASLLPVADQLATDARTVQQKLTTDDEAGDPTNLTLRVHEILEDALRDHLSGIDDEGSGMAYAETEADTEATRTVLGEVSGLIDARMPTLVPTITTQLDSLQAALLATRADGRWQPVSAVPPAARQRVDAAIGAVLESLSIEPDLLEVPPSH